MSPTNTFVLQAVASMAADSNPRRASAAAPPPALDSHPPSNLRASPPPNGALGLSSHPTVSPSDLPPSPPPALTAGLVAARQSRRAGKRGEPAGQKGTPREDPTALSTVARWQGLHRIEERRRRGLQMFALGAWRHYSRRERVAERLGQRLIRRAARGVTVAWSRLSERHADRADHVRLLLGRRHLSLRVRVWRHWSRESARCGGSVCAAMERRSTRRSVSAATCVWRALVEFVMGVALAWHHISKVYAQRKHLLAVLSEWHEAEQQQQAAGEGSCGEQAKVIYRRMRLLFTRSVNARTQSYTMTRETRAAGLGDGSPGGTPQQQQPPPPILSLQVGAEWRKLLFRAHRRRQAGFFLANWRAAVAQKHLAESTQAAAAHVLSLTAQVVTALVVPAAAAAQASVQMQTGGGDAGRMEREAGSAVSSLFAQPGSTGASSSRANEARLKKYQGKERLFETLAAALPILLPRAADPWRAHMLAAWAMARWMHQTLKLRFSRRLLHSTIQALHDKEFGPRAGSSVSAHNILRSTTPSNLLLLTP